MVHARGPNDGHHRLMQDLNGTLDRYEAQGISTVEQIALFAQIIGQKITDLDPLAYDAGEVMRSVAANIAGGNANRAGLIATPIGQG
jgi:hypothetical protein